MIVRELETCCACDSPTGRAGKHDDSLYAADLGPYCTDCWYDLPEKLATINADLLAALEATMHGGHYDECLAKQCGRKSYDEPVVCLPICEQIRAAVAKAKARKE